jgi:hypothetical protein
LSLGVIYFHRFCSCIAYLGFHILLSEITCLDIVPEFILLTACCTRSYLLRLSTPVAWKPTRTLRRPGHRTACKWRKSPPLQVEGHFSHLDAPSLLAGAGRGVKRRKERGKKMEKKEKKGKEKKGKREKNKEKRKNGLSNFLEIVIDNLYLLYYYQVIK